VDSRFDASEEILRQREVRLSRHALAAAMPITTTSSTPRDPLSATASGPGRTDGRSD
jgi:hypothetical protein